MLVRLTKLDDRRHVLELERAGAVERAELETRSTLHHDLTHLAVEEAGGFDDGFFGLLACGASYADLSLGPRRGGEPPAAASMEIEAIVARLQRLAREDVEPAALHESIVASYAIQDAAPPRWFTVEFVTAVRARLRELLGRWRATPFGGTLELAWERG